MNGSHLFANHKGTLITHINVLMHASSWLCIRSLGCMQPN